MSEWAFMAKTEAIYQIIQSITEATAGEVSVSAKDLQTGKRIELYPNRRVGTASVIKLPIMAAALQAVQEGIVDLDEPMTLQDKDKVIGSGVLQNMSAGISLPLRDVMLLMIIVSDNTATNMIIDRIGLSELNRRFRTLGMKETKLNKYVFIDADPPTKDSEKFGLGVTTAREMAALLEKIARRELLNETLDQVAFDILSKQELKQGIPRFLPNSWGFAGKSGAVGEIRNDTGIVTLPEGRQFALSIFCWKLVNAAWSPDTPGLLVIGKLAEVICAYFTGSSNC